MKLGHRFKCILPVILAASMLLALGGCAADQAESGSGEMDAYMVESLHPILVNVVTQLNQMSPADKATTLETAKKQKDNLTASAVEGFESVLKELGPFINIDDAPANATARIDDDGAYIVTAVAIFGKDRLVDVTFRCVLDATGSSISPTESSMSFDPRYTFGERMAKAGMNTLMGMGTVFSVLIIICLVISCFKFINEWENRAKGKASPKATSGSGTAKGAVAGGGAVAAGAGALASSGPGAVAAGAASGTGSTAGAAPSGGGDLELVAVITAAIAAATGKSVHVTGVARAPVETVQDGLVVRSIRRVSGGGWKRT
ncbi:MAG: OadG family protein [Lachnospiraceae bacterium]|jgi:Na+-transporting methylmalonyl-CoA/oxaloacetate decarboxylase gamma subunit|nr:OadG family protein [Lachnospiraceae bacterium]